jgi:hypothetical protein
MAGLSGDINDDVHGFGINISGYNDSIKPFLEKLVEILVKF